MAPNELSPANYEDPHRAIIAYWSASTTCSRVRSPKA
jgi:hypothetical protein